MFKPIPRIKITSERFSQARSPLKKLQSRDNLKQNNREKNLLNQKLRDGKGVVAASRDRWKSCSKALHKENNRLKTELEQQIAAAQAEILRERTRADQEQERAEKLQSEIANIREKKSGTHKSYSENGRESAPSLVSYLDDYHVHQAHFASGYFISGCS